MTLCSVLVLDVTRYTGKISNDFTLSVSTEVAMYMGVEYYSIYELLVIRVSTKVILPLLISLKDKDTGKPSLYV